MAAAGESVHGEADLVEAIMVGPEGQAGDAAILDAGCGTGRVAIELARRGFSITGIDLDPTMISRARSKAPDLAWIHGDLGVVKFDRQFDAVVLAGNVMIFVTPGTEGDVVTNLAAALKPGGAMVSGFSLEAGRLSLSTFDRLTAASNLALETRWATWDAQPYEDGPYAVSLHRKAALKS